MRKKRSNPSKTSCPASAPAWPSGSRLGLVQGPFDLFEYSKDRFLALAESYAWLNPHLTLRVSWNGEEVIDIKASNPGWRKWLPIWPTSAHWCGGLHAAVEVALHDVGRADEVALSLALPEAEDP